MSAQIKYGYSTPIGEAGGIVDLGPYAVDSFSNEAEDNVMKFGVGVVMGSVPGKNANLPADGAKSGDFLGIVTNRRTTEYGLDGKVYIRKHATLGVMRYGRIYGRVVKGVEVKFGDPVYLVTTGDNVGCFTNVSTGNVAVNARFAGAVDTTAQIAAIDLFNGPAKA